MLPPECAWPSERGSLQDPVVATTLARFHESEALPRLSGARKKQGAWYTPGDLARALTKEALSILGHKPEAVLDPACGSGIFLQSVAQAVPASSLHGRDLDPLAIALARACIWEISGEMPDGLTVGDGLEDDFGGQPFDLILGNPPFLSQTSSATARSEEKRTRRKADTQGAVSGLADEASAFLLRSLELLSDQGVCCLILPKSFLSTAHCQPVRDAVLRQARVQHIWSGDASVFDTVEVIGLIIQSGQQGLRRMEQPQPGKTWSSLIADPSLPRPKAPESSQTLSDIADATADFRDQYYGLKDALIDEPESDLPRLITSGLIDLAECRWGAGTARIHKQDWLHPRVDLSKLDERMSTWAESRLGPKILLATQTPILEVWVDEQGDCLPSVPVITIRPKTGEDIWKLAAAIARPEAALWAHRNFHGAALTGQAIKISAKQALCIPLPKDQESWEEGALQMRLAHKGDTRISLMNFGYAMTNDKEVLSWWLSRLRRRKA